MFRETFGFSSVFEYSDCLCVFVDKNAHNVHPRKCNHHDGKQFFNSF